MSIYFDIKLQKYLKGKSKNALKDCISKYDLYGNILGTYYSISEACFSVHSDFKGNINRLSLSSSPRRTAGDSAVRQPP